MVNKFGIFISIVLVSNTINAAGFDCSKAYIEIEKRICSNKRLSKLDSELSEKYKQLYSKLNNTGKTNLKELQRKWLKLRNADEYDIETRFRYRNQISILNFFLRTIESKNISKLEIKKVFSLLIDKNLPAPDVIQEFNKTTYLLDISNIARLQQGLYAASIDKDVIKRIAGGVPKIIHKPTNQKPVLVYKSVSLSRGIMSTNIGFIYESDSVVGVSAKHALSFLQDGVTGGCGRGEAIGINISKKMTDYNFEKLDSGLTLTINFKETNCQSGKSFNKIKKYRFSNNNLTDI